MACVVRLIPSSGIARGTDRHQIGTRSGLDRGGDGEKGRDQKGEGWGGLGY